MKECDREECLYYNPKIEYNCSSRDHLRTGDKSCPVFELDN